MSLNFPSLPDQVPQRGTASSRNIFKSLYLAQGWSFNGEFPNLPKAVVIVAPHTSNFDGLFGVLAMLGVGLNITIFGNDSLFKTPLKGLFEWIGIIPINRDSPHGVTQEIIDIIKQKEQIWIAIAPEGTRKKAEKIKSGFYHIAMGAQIPIAIFSLDYDRKMIHSLGILQPTGNYEQDLEDILNRFKGKFSPKRKSLLSIPLQKLLKNG